MGSQRDVHVACMAAVVHMAKRADEVAQQLRDVLDADGNGTITEFEFRSQWNHALSTVVIDPLAREAAWILRSVKQAREDAALRESEAEAADRFAEHVAELQRRKAELEAATRNTCGACWGPRKSDIEKCQILSQ